MKAWEIVGYGLDGDIYCLGCIPDTNCKCETDENGLCAENCLGYGPNPIFADNCVDEICTECGGNLL